MKEVTGISKKTYKSKHENFLLSFIDDAGEKRKFEFVKGELVLTDPKDIALVDQEFKRRYMVMDGDKPRLENGKEVYAGDIKFIPIDEYEKARLSSPIQIKTSSGKTYVLTEADIIQMVEMKEAVKENPVETAGEGAKEEKSEAVKDKESKGKSK